MRIKRIVIAVFAAAGLAAAPAVTVAASVSAGTVAATYSPNTHFYV